MCCEYVVLPLADIREDRESVFIPVAKALSEDEQKWVNLHEGMTVVDATHVLVRADRPWHVLSGQPGMPNPRQGSSLRVDTRCRALTESGTCQLYGSPKRPEMCSLWPDQPEQVADLEGCAYQGAFTRA